MLEVYSRTRLRDTACDISLHHSIFLLYMLYSSKHSSITPNSHPRDSLRCSFTVLSLNTDLAPFTAL